MLQTCEGVNALSNLCNKNKRRPQYDPCFMFKHLFLCLFSNFLDRIMEMAVKCHDGFCMHCMLFIVDSFFGYKYKTT